MDDQGSDEPRIRVLLASIGIPLPAMLEQTIRHEPDLLLIGAVSNPTDLLLAASSGVDVVVILAPTSFPPPGVCSHLLNESAYIRIIVVSPHVDSGTLYWLGLRRRRLPQSSLGGLAGHIRSAFSIDTTV